jgi:F-type H+-transporting ATPase subunit b
MEFIYEAEFWVAVSFFIFIGVLVYLDIHKKVASALDARALRISKELEEARRLREEAEKLLADYRRKLGDVVTEVDNIIALAAKQAETLAAETRQSLKEHVDRRIKLAEERIARAEMEAVRELRNDAVDVAIASAQNLIAAKLTPDRAQKLVRRPAARRKPVAHTLLTAESRVHYLSMPRTQEKCVRGNVRNWHLAEVSCLRVIRPLYGLKRTSASTRTDVAE